MINRENMEKWINALEAYDQEPAIGALIDDDEKMCAVGIGMNVMRPGCLRDIWGAVNDWPNWIGVRTEDDPYDIALKPDDSPFKSVVRANDQGKQSPWTIAQRLRETYLKEES